MQDKKYQLPAGLIRNKKAVINAVYNFVYKLFILVNTRY